MVASTPFELLHPLLDGLGPDSARAEHVDDGLVGDDVLVVLAGIEPRLDEPLVRLGAFELALGVCLRFEHLVGARDLPVGLAGEAFLCLKLKPGGVLGCFLGQHVVVQRPDPRLETGLAWLAVRDGAEHGRMALPRLLKLGLARGRGRRPPLDRLVELLAGGDAQLVEDALGLVDLVLPLDRCESDFLLGFDDAFLDFPWMRAISA